MHSCWKRTQVSVNVKQAFFRLLTSFFCRALYQSTLEMPIRHKGGQQAQPIVSFERDSMGPQIDVNATNKFSVMHTRGDFEVKGTRESRLMQTVSPAFNRQLIDH